MKISNDIFRTDLTYFLGLRGLRSTKVKTKRAQNCLQIPVTICFLDLMISQLTGSRKPKMFTNGQTLKWSPKNFAIDFFWTIESFYVKWCETQLCCLSPCNFNIVLLNRQLLYVVVCPKKTLFSNNEALSAHCHKNKRFF